MSLERDIKELRVAIRPLSFLFLEYMRKQKGKEGKEGKPYGPWYIRPKAGLKLTLGGRLTEGVIHETNKKIQDSIEVEKTGYKKELKTALEECNYQNALIALDKIENSSQDVFVIQAPYVGFNESWVLELPMWREEEQIENRRDELMVEIRPIHELIMDQVLQKYGQAVDLHLTQ